MMNAGMKHNNRLVTAQTIHELALAFEALLPKQPDGMQAPAGTGACDKIASTIAQLVDEIEVIKG